MQKNIFYRLKATKCRGALEAGEIHGGVLQVVGLSPKWTRQTTKEGHESSETFNTLVFLPVYTDQNTMFCTVLGNKLHL